MFRVASQVPGSGLVIGCTIAPELAVGSAKTLPTSVELAAMFQVSFAE